jgi:ribose 5-phosphate isomerase B
MRIAVAADHNGVVVKEALVRWLTERGHQVMDRGRHDDEVVDYPPLCADVCHQVVDGSVERAIVVGGTGGGEAIACNKIRGIRAGLCHTTFLAEISSGHNATNVLVLGAKVVGVEDALDITETWLRTPFKGGRHQHRVEQIEALERGEELV